MNDRLKEELKASAFWITAHLVILIGIFLFSGDQSPLILQGGTFLNLQVDQQNSVKGLRQTQTVPQPKDPVIEQKGQNKNVLLEGGIVLDNNPVEPMKNQQPIENYSASEIEDLANKYCSLFKQGQLKIRGDFAKNVPSYEIFATFGCGVRITSRTNQREYFGNRLQKRPYLTAPMSPSEVPSKIAQQISNAKDSLWDIDYQVDLLLKPTYEVLIYRELYRLLKSEGLAEPRNGDVFRCVLYPGNRVELTRVQ